MNEARKSAAHTTRAFFWTTPLVDASPASETERSPDDTSSRVVHAPSDDTMRIHFSTRTSILPTRANAIA